MSNRNQGGDLPGLLLVMLPFFSVFPALGLILLGLSGGLVSACIGKGAAALDLLKACRNWCLILCVFAVLALVITMAATAVSVKALRARQDRRSLAGSAVKLGGVILFLEAILLGALVFRGDVLSTIMDAQADIRQIESGETEIDSFWFYPGSTAAHLPGPYGAGQPSPLVKYYVSIIPDLNWEPFLFPESLGFDPDEGTHISGNYGTYHSSENLTWNEMNVEPYQLAYTSRLHFVVEVIPHSLAAD